MCLFEFVRQSVCLCGISLPAKQADRKKKSTKRSSAHQPEPTGGEIPLRAALRPSAAQKAQDSAPGLKRAAGEGRTRDGSRGLFSASFHRRNNGPTPNAAPGMIFAPAQEMMPESKCDSKLGPAKLQAELGLSGDSNADF